jgi:tetratricopeptide (TPR) repeat protein
MPTAGFDLVSLAELCLPEDQDIPQSTGYQNYLEDNDLVDHGTGLEETVEALVQGAWLEQRDDELWLPDAVREVVMQQYPKHSRYFKGLIESVRLSYFGEEYGPVKGNALFISHLQSLLPWLEYGETYLTLHRLLIKTYNDLVYWYEEEKELKLLLDVVEKHEGQWSEQFWDICINLSECCRRTGHIEAADHFSQIQLTVAQAIYANHSNLARAQTERGSVLHDLGDYARAAQLLELALGYWILNFGEEHPNVAAIQSNLALVLSDLGDYARAAQLLELALGYWIRNFEPDNPTVAVVQSNLATVVRYLGDYPRAALLFEFALGYWILNFEPDHPTIAVLQSNLASVYYQSDRLDEAKILWEQALQTVEKNLGVSHPYYRKIKIWLVLVNEKLKATN